MAKVKPPYTWRWSLKPKGIGYNEPPKNYADCSHYLDSLVLKRRCFMITTTNRYTQSGNLYNMTVESEREPDMSLLPQECIYITPEPVEALVSINKNRLLFVKADNHLYDGKTLYVDNKLLYDLFRQTAEQGVSKLGYSNLDSSIIVKVRITFPRIIIQSAETSQIEKIEIL